MGAFPRQREIDRYTPMSRPLRLKPYLEDRFDYQFYHIDPSFHVNYYLDYATTYAKLVTRIMKSGPDAVLVWNLYYVPIILGVNRGLNVVDITDSERSITHNRWLKGLLVDMVEERYLQKMDLVICADYASYRNYLDAGLSDIKYVPNGVDLELLRPYPKIEKQYDACYLGKIEKQYKLETMIDGIAISGARCLFIGRGEDMDFYREYAREREADIKFQGYAKYKRVPELLSRCRMGLVPAVESASLKMLEYLACGLPVASPGKLDPRLDEVVTPIKQGTPEEYTESLEAVMALDTTKWNTLSTRCRDSVKPFSIQKMADEYCAAIEELMDS